MKKTMVGVLAALAFSMSVSMAQADNTNVVNVQQSAGSVAVNQCVSVAGNCNNPDLTVNFNGDVDAVTINGKTTVINGADGKDGKDGKDGATGATGATGAKGDTGADGKSAYQSAVDNGFTGTETEFASQLTSALPAAQAAQATADGAVIKNTEQDAAITNIDTKVDANKAETDAALSGKVDLSTFNDSVSTQTGINTDLKNQIDTKVSTDTYNADKATQAGIDADQNAAIAGKVDSSAYATDKANQASKDSSQDTAINKAQSTANVAKSAASTAQSTANVALGLGVANSIGIAALNETKVDKTTQAAKDASQDAEIDSKVDKTTYASDKEDQANTDAAQNAALSTETSERTAADNALSDTISTNKAAQAVTDSKQDKAIASKASKKDLVKETASRKSADDALSSRIDSNDATLVDHDQRITSNTQRIGSVEGRVSNLEQSTNKRFNDVDKRIGENRKVASAGIAGAGAMANIPGLTQNGNFSVGAGIGGYDGEQAVAVGFNARVSQNVTTKVTVSTNTQSEVLWGAGVGVEW